jgi:hypothetical protein
MSGVQEYKDFYAVCDHRPGPEPVPRLRVGGTVVFRETDCSARLEDFEGNTGINPNFLYLNLVLTPPAEGSAPQEVLTEVELEEWRPQGGAPGLEYDEVHFRVQGSPDELQLHCIKVEHPM